MRTLFAKSSKGRPSIDGDCTMRDRRRVCARECGLRPRKSANGAVRVQRPKAGAHNRENAPTFVGCVTDEWKRDRWGNNRSIRSASGLLLRPSFASPHADTPSSSGERGEDGCARGGGNVAGREEIPRTVIGIAVRNRAVPAERQMSDPRANRCRCRCEGAC